MGARRAPPKQSDSARRAQEAKYTKKANKNKTTVKVRATQKKFKRAVAESNYTDKAKKNSRTARINATQKKFKKLQQAPGSGSRNRRSRRPNPNMLRGRTIKRGRGRPNRATPYGRGGGVTGRRPRGGTRRSIARTSAINRRLLNRAGSGRRQIRRSVGRTMSLNRANLRGRMGRSGRGFRGFRGRRR